MFEAEDGWRYTLWVTSLPVSTRGCRGQNAYIDAAHRVHARVEDAIRRLKVQAGWPWAAAIVTAWGRISVRPQAP